MKNRVLIMFVAFSLSISCFAQDFIIFRDGTERSGKIIQVDNDRTLYKAMLYKKTMGRKIEVTRQVDNKRIYMLKYKTRGNVFFNLNGERIFNSTAGVVKPARNAILIYLREGREIQAYNVNMNDVGLVFQESNKKKAPLRSVNKQDVFMIKYPDGTKDILTDFGIEPELPLDQESEVPVGNATTLFPPLDGVDQKPSKSSEQVRKYPCKAIITTKNNSKIKAMIYAEEEESISYKREYNLNGPFYTILKKNVKSIDY